MKRLLRPEIVIVGTAALALLGWSTVGAATGSRSHGVAIHQVSSDHEATPNATAEPEHETPAPVVNQPAPEPVDNETAENENEAAEEANEAAEDANEPAENEPAENEPAENPAPPTVAPPPTTSSRTFSLVGGTVTFMCTGNSISLSSAVPAAGFSVETDSEDGGQQIEVKFESDAHKSEIRAACVGGQVQATEIREESD